MKLVLAAVDEGILSLTRYASPNPTEFYLGKRALGIDIRDLYGRLIRAEEGLPGKVRSGAGSPRLRKEQNASGIQHRSTRTVALYHRDITFNQAGEAFVELDIPDFNGRLRLMAVAYGATVLAQSSRPLVVRDPLIADLLMPRFLAPGDVATATLSLQNLSGRAIEAELALSSAGGFLDISDPATRISLAPGQRIDRPVRIAARTVGAAGLGLRVTAPGLQPIERSWNLAVRPAWPIATNRQVTPIPPGEAVPVPAVLDGGFLDGTTRHDFDVLAGPNLDPASLVFDLDRYGYWCTEQTVSKAFPALFQPVLAKAYGLDLDKAASAALVEHAITKLQDRQKASGGFGIWRTAGHQNAWLNIYVADFLSRAQESGYRIADSILLPTISRLKLSAGQSNDTALHVAAYALYVLARRGDVPAGEVRYFADQYGSDIPTRLGTGHLAAALHIVGEQDLAETYFLQALKKRRSNKRIDWDYGSDLRDGSALLALIAEALPNANLTLDLVEALEAEFDRRAYFNTQEMAWLTRAVARLVHDGAERGSFLFNGQPVAMDQLRWSAPTDGSVLGQVVRLENRGDRPIRAIRTTRGIPKSPPVASANGFRITRTLYTLAGEPVSMAELSAVKRNQRFVVLIEGRALNNTDHDALVVDLLPAGFEIENEALGPARGSSHFDFLPVLSKPEFADRRDDRYVAAINLGNRYGRNGQEFAVAYVVRAVTPGDYVFPGVFVEDMYQPKYRATGPASRLVVQP